MRVLVVDDSKAVQTSFGSLLATVPNIEVVGYAGDVASALAMIEARAPDLVVLDVELHRGESGIEVLQHVKRTQPGAEVIVLSNLPWKAMRSQLLAAGAAAYFDKANEFRLARDWIAARAAVVPPSAVRVPTLTAPPAHKPVGP